MKILITVAIAIFTYCAFAQDEDYKQSGFGISVGAKTFSLQSTKFSHNTHSGDWFLPNSNVPGSAGTTSLDGGNVYYVSFGINYCHPIPSISKNLSWRAEIGGLAGGQEDKHKNANDNRPDANAAFVYSDSTWGVYGSFGLIYYVGENLYIGGDAEYNGIFIDNGWDRFGSKQSQKTDVVSMFTGGPVVGFDFTKNFGIEANAQFGNSQIYGLKLRWKF